MRTRASFGSWPPSEHTTTLVSLATRVLGAVAKVQEMTRAAGSSRRPYLACFACAISS
jgi:hypothetical protein